MGIMSDNATTTAPNLRAAAEALLRAVRAEMSPKWECNSYHPSLAPAAAALRAVLQKPPARSLTDELMDCVDRLGSEKDSVDPRVWDHLLVYAPKQPAASTPPGYALVPLEPTAEMLPQAWREAGGKCDHDTLRRVYAAMIAAAPAGVVAHESAIGERQDLQRLLAENERLRSLLAAQQSQLDALHRLDEIRANREGRAERLALAAQRPAANEWVRKHVGEGAALVTRLYNETPNVRDAVAAGTWIQLASQVLAAAPAVPAASGAGPQLTGDGIRAIARRHGWNPQFTGFNPAEFADDLLAAAQAASTDPRDAENERLRAENQQLREQIASMDIMAIAMEQRKSPGPFAAINESHRAMYGSVFDPMGDDEAGAAGTTGGA